MALSKFGHAVFSPFAVTAAPVEVCVQPRPARGTGLQYVLEKIMVHHRLEYMTAEAWRLCKYPTRTLPLTVCRAPVFCVTTAGMGFGSCQGQSSRQAGGPVVCREPLLKGFLVKLCNVWVLYSHNNCCIALAAHVEDTCTDVDLRYTLHKAL